jgi:hypothetical protein
MMLCPGPMGPCFPKVETAIAWKLEGCERKMAPFSQIRRSHAREPEAVCVNPKGKASMPFGQRPGGPQLRPRRGLVGWPTGLVPQPNVVSIWTTLPRAVPGAYAGLDAALLG